MGETIVMWWNFVGRSHDEVAAYRASYQAAIGAEDGADGADGAGAGGAGGAEDVAPFPIVADHRDPLPAPALPNARLRPRS